MVGLRSVDHVGLKNLEKQGDRNEKVNFTHTTS